MKRTLFIVAIVAISLQTIAQQSRVESKGYALFAKDGTFQPYQFTRHAVGDNDILIDILYCGICHSDLHSAHSDWGEQSYPMVPGHEIVGKVSQVGKNVTRFRVGQYAGVGCMVNACGECENCKNQQQQYCSKRVLTYAATDFYHNNELTQGGYANNIVIGEDFAIQVPSNAQLDKVAPLLCAGITTYSPIKFTNIKSGDQVGIAGFGGLGHMAVKYAVKLGAQVTVFDITEDKRQSALDMGAVKYVNVNNPDELKGLTNTLRVIISTIPTRYDPAMYLTMLKLEGEMVILGLPAGKDLPSINIGLLTMMGKRKIYGSQIGGIEQTQQMLDYSIANNIYPDIEIISIDKLDQAYQNVADGKVKFRYVIDMKTLK